MQLERRYEVRAAELWELWTTTAGFEAWWGPDGFRAAVRTLDLRVGGELAYDLIAVRKIELSVGGELSYDMLEGSPEHLAHLEQAGMPSARERHGTFVEISPLERLKIRHRIDFIPGVAPYAHDVLVELLADGPSVRMVITLAPHLDDAWARHELAAWDSQLMKVPAALAARCTW